MTELPDHEGWDCPTCKQIHPEETDYECGCCGHMASHHLSITTMCRVTKEWRSRADRAELDNAKLKGEINLWRAEAQRWREQVLRYQTWPHDPNPFDSPDHDNDSKTYK